MDQSEFSTQTNCYIMTLKHMWSIFLIVGHILKNIQSHEHWLHVCIIQYSTTSVVISHRLSHGSPMSSITVKNASRRSLPVVSPLSKCHCAVTRLMKWKSKTTSNQKYVLAVLIPCPCVNCPCVSCYVPNICRKSGLFSHWRMFF